MTWQAEREKLLGLLLRHEYQRIKALPTRPDDWFGSHVWTLGQARDDLAFMFSGSDAKRDLERLAATYGEADKALRALSRQGAPTGLLNVFRRAHDATHASLRPRLVLNEAARELFNARARPAAKLGVEAYDLRCYRVGALYGGALNADAADWEAASVKTVSTARARWKAEGVEVFDRIAYRMCDL